MQDLAVASRDIHNPDTTICKNYYLFGKQENRRIFPFNIHGNRNVPESGQLTFTVQNRNSGSGSEQRKAYYLQAYEWILKTTGLLHVNRELVISDQFMAWINEFSPDVIYTQLSSLELIRLVDSLHDKLKIPVVIHIMDDWPATISKNGIFKTYWRKVIDRDFQKLLSKASILLSISESMSVEYLKRYGRQFIPFHNPLDIGFWHSTSRKNYHAGDVFTVLYAGRIGTGIRKCFFDIAKAIQNLRNAGLQIEFHIQTVNGHSVLKGLADYKFVKFRKPLQYAELPMTFAQADLLILPNDFDSKSVSFLKYSMPTKASEYMISGTPILVYSSSLTAVARHAEAHGWAMVVAERNIEKLGKAIAAYCKNEDLRKEFGTRAFRYASENYDGELIREQFRETICAVDKTLDGRM